MRRIYFTFFLFALLVIVKSDDYTIKIGYDKITDVSVPNLIFIRDSFITQAEEIEKSLEVFKDFVEDPKNEVKVNGKNVKIELVLMENDYLNFVDNACKMIDKGVRIIIPPFGTPPALNYYDTIYTENYQRCKDMGLENIPDDAPEVLLISTASSDHTIGHERDSLFSVYPSVFYQVTAIFPFLRGRAQSASLIETADVRNAQTSVNICEGFADELKKSGISKIDSFYYMGENASNLEALKNYTTVANQVMEQDNDVVIYCGLHETPLLEISKEFYRNEYVPRAAISLTRENQVEPSLNNFWLLPSSTMSRNYGFESSKYFKTVDVYREEYLKKYGEIAEVFELGLFPIFAGEMIVESLDFIMQRQASTMDENTLPSATVRELINYIRTSKFNTFLGELRFSAKNENMNPGVTLQAVDGNFDTLGPYTISNSTLVYPMPTWNEKKPRDSYHGVEYAAIVILCLGLVNSGGWLIYLIIKRDTPAFFSSSPIFLMSMLLGSMLIYVGLFFWMPHHLSNSGCSIHVGALVIGFILLFGSMVVKTWRVNVLFSQKTLEVFHISNTQVAFFLTILLSIDVILYLVWVLLTKPELEDNIVNIHKMYENYYTCKTTSSGLITIYVIIGYHALLFIYGGYLAIKVRKIPIKIYDESKIIMFCIYNVGLVAIVVSILEGTNASGDRYVQFGLRTILIVLSSGITINTMMISKVTGRRKLNLSSSSGSSGTQMHSNIDRSSRHIDWEKKQMDWKKERKKLRKERDELKDALDALRNK